MTKYFKYESYKETSYSHIGVVPAHWDLKRTKFLFERQNRPPRECDETVTAFRDGQVTLRINRRTDGFTQSLKEIGYQGVRCGDLVVHAMDGFAGAIGVSDSDGKCSPVYSICKPIEGVANSKYYGLYLRNLALNGYVESLAKGIRERSTEFRYAELKEVWLPEPPIDEQTQIANFLDHEIAKIDTLIDKQQQLIKLLKEKRQAVISHAVTKGLNPDAPMKDSGVEWLGEVPEHWITPALKYACSLLKDGTHLPPPRVDDGIPLLSVRNIIDGKFDTRDDDSMISKADFEKLNESFKVLEGDVLLAVVGGTLGKTAIVEKMDSFHIQRSVAVFRCRPNLLLNTFLNLIFQSKQFDELLWSNVGFSAQPGIYLGTLAGFWVPVPPLEEQNQIVDKVSINTRGYDELLSVSQRKIDLLQERRTALISAAVTGKIDVRNWKPAPSEQPMEATA